MRKTQLKVADFEGGQGAKQCKWCLEAAKGKGMDSPLELPKRRAILDFCPPELKD